MSGGERARRSALCHRRIARDPCARADPDPRRDLCNQGPDRVARDTRHRRPDFGIVADMDEIADDPQMLASEALVPFADDSSLTVNSPIWIEGQEKVRPRPAPAVGEHSEAVLRKAGYTEAEIGALRVEGVIV